MPRHTLPLLPVMACLLLLTSALPAACQGGVPALGLEDLGLGDLGGMGNLGILGALGGLGGGMAAPVTPAPTIIISQPVMLIHGDSLYVAYQGTVTRFDLRSLQKQAEATYGAPTSGLMHSVPAQGLQMLPPGQARPAPPLVPGATPGP